ncbi:MAG: PEP/pyruvate-binding domain-containing protein, partial [Proteobacteria bacterium]|nr:PEP/pyruvate-binding domain-containing protein [Pseudomonadota bacterium]
MHFRKLVSYWFNQLFFPGTYLQKQYRAFKSLLENDKQAHLLIAQLEEIYHNRLQVDTAAIEKTYLQLSACVSQVIADLLTLSPVRYGNLADYFKKFDDYIRLMLSTPVVNCNPPYVLLPENITAENGELVGGKAYNLSTVKTALGLPIPEGFVVTTRAYHRFFELNKLRKPINSFLADLDLKSLKSLKNAFNAISQLIQNAEIPEEVGIAIQDALGNLQSSFGENIRFAVRSSAVGEDSKISFA